MKEFDIVIVGGGPAGIMAAIASGNSKVAILEKNNKLGLKLLITGGGRCNITNNKPIRKLLNSYKDKNFLKHSFYTLTNEKLLKLFEDKGLGFKEEDDNRIFPETDKACDVLDILKEYLNNTEIILNYPVTDIIKKDGCFLINDEIKASKVIITTGGMTYPHTGSNGDGFKLASQLSQPIKTPYYGLTPLICDDNLLKELSGVGLYNVVVKNKSSSFKGDVLITHTGLTGPAVLNLSNEALNEIAIDLIPDLNREELNNKFIKDSAGKGKLKLKNYLKVYLTSSFIEYFLNRLDINGDKQLSNLSKKERNSIVGSLKGLKFKIVAVNKDLSKITVGGVDLNYINSKTMESTLIEGLYFAGEVLDTVGPTGGYNLKIAFSTGYLAGQSAYSNLG